LGADEKRIRTQSTISDKGNPKAWPLFSITVFWYGCAFHPYQKTVDARSAQSQFSACDGI